MSPKLPEGWQSRIALETGFSLFVSGLLLALGAVMRRLSDPVPLWSLVFVPLVAALTIPSLLEQRRLASRRFFLIMPAFEHKNWFAELLSELLGALERGNSDLVVKLPAHDFDAQSMAELLRQIQKQRDAYAGGFIIAARPGEIRKELLDFCSKFGRPVVFLDVPPFEQADDYPASTAFVGYSGETIGRTAADVVAQWAKADHKRAPRVLVVASDVQRDRQNAFVERFDQVFPRSKSVVTEEGRFSRSRARSTAGDFLESGIGGKPFDYVFCTNDEMALGVLDAESTVSSTQPTPTVIGVDGTPEVKALVDSGSHIKATVVQSAAKVASEAVAVMGRLVDKMNVDVERRLTPDVYPGKRPKT